MIKKIINSFIFLCFFSNYCLSANLNTLSLPFATSDLINFIAKKPTERRVKMSETLTKLYDEHLKKKDNFELMLPILIKIAERQNSSYLDFENINDFLTMLKAKNIEVERIIPLFDALVTNKQNDRFSFSLIPLSVLLKKNIITNENLDQWLPLLIKIAVKTGDHALNIYDALSEIFKNKKDLEIWLPVINNIGNTVNEKIGEATMNLTSLFLKNIITEKNEREWQFFLLFIIRNARENSGDFFSFLSHISYVPEYQDVFISIVYFLLDNDGQKNNFYELLSLGRVFFTNPFFEDFIPIIFGKFKNPIHHPYQIIDQDLSLGKKIKIGWNYLLDISVSVFTAVDKPDDAKQELKKRINLAKEISLLIGMSKIIGSNKNVIRFAQKNIQKIVKNYQTTADQELQMNLFKEIQLVVLAYLVWPEEFDKTEDVLALAKQKIPREYQENKFFELMLIMIKRTYNPRSRLGSKELQELSESIKQILIILFDSRNFDKQQTVREYIEQLQDNPQKKAELIAAGYSEKLWKEEISIQTNIDYFSVSSSPLSWGKRRVPKKKYLTIKLITDFFETLKTSGDDIVGCYASNGSFSAKVVEMGLMVNNAIISVYDTQTGKELENAEVIFTKYGMFVFVLYSNNHGYDTSELWHDFFKEISNFVPYILVDENSAGMRQEYVGSRNFLKTLKFTNFFAPAVFAEAHFDPSFFTASEDQQDFTLTAVLNKKTFEGIGRLTPELDKGKKQNVFIDNLSKFIFESVRKNFGIKFGFKNTIKLLLNNSNKKTAFSSFDAKKAGISETTSQEMQVFVRLIVQLVQRIAINVFETEISELNFKETKNLLDCA